MQSRFSGKIKILRCVALCLLTLNFSSLLAQTEIRIAPTFGWQAIQSYVKEDAHASDYFRSNNFYINTIYGLSVQFDVKKNWLFFSNLNTSRPRISYKANDGSSGAHWVNRNCTSLSIGVQKKISTHGLFKLNPKKVPGSISRLKKLNDDDELYWLLFRLKVISGMSHDWIANFPGSNIVRSTSSSLYFGFGLQFFDRDKDRLQLSLIYSMGLTEIAEWEVFYTAQGMNYYGTIGTKGAFFAIQMAYPFRLLTINRMKK